MDFLLDLLQAAGVGAAIGIRPLLPTLLVGALAAGDLGVDFEKTDFSFLEAAPFLIAVVVVVAVVDLLRRRAGDERFEAGAGFAAFAALAVVLAALEGAGTLADRDHSVVAGILVAVAACVLGLFAVRPLFARVRGRLDAAAAAMLPVYREGLALLAAGLSVAFPPLAIVVIAALLWLLLGGRRREGEKYAGLRILR